MQVTNPDRVLFPDGGITKADVVEHYRRVAERMLPHVTDRPLTLERYPKGIGERGFMQKNVADHFPDFIGRFPVPKRDGETVHPVITSTEGLLYLANLSTITLHVPTATTADPWHPDRLIFDLDPSESDIAGARFAARQVWEALSTLDLQSAVMATGSKGYHVIAFLQPSLPNDSITEMAQGLATLLAADNPARLTTEFIKEDRRGRVFIDWLRNRYPATAVAPYSLRPRADAPVAAPLGWEELDDLPPRAITLANVEERLTRGDPWQLVPRQQEASSAADAVKRLLADRGITLEPIDRFGRGRRTVT